MMMMIQENVVLVIVSIVVMTIGKRYLYLKVEFLVRLVVLIVD